MTDIVINLSQIFWQFFHCSLSWGNKSQFLNLAATKAKVDGARVLLDNIQLEEEDTETTRYQAISAVKSLLQEAVEIINGRLDLIQKVDQSKAGWSAAAVYEKSNGTLLKDDSRKLFEEAEKKVLDAKKTAAKEGYKTLFRGSPARSGRSSGYQKTARG